MKTLFEGKKLYAVIIAFLLIITFFITFHIIRNHYKYVFKNVITENTLTANLLSSLMYEHQKAAISILESYAQRLSFIDAVKKKDFHRAFYHLKSLSEHHTEIDALFITDQYGTLWANYPVDSKGFGKNLAYRDWYKGVSKKWRPYISTLYRRVVLEKGLAVSVSVPILDRKGKVVGILSGAQRVSFFATLIRANTLDPRKSIALLDQEGNIIFSNAIPYQEKITKYPEVHVLEKVVAGGIIDMEIADAKEKGSISYVSIAPVRGIGWSVIVGQEKNAILKSLYRYFILSAATGFVIFLFLAVSLLYFRREYRYRKTKELQASEELYRTLFDEALDGICLADAETGIIIDCNQTLAALVCRERAELIGRPQTILHPPQDDKEAFSLTFKQHLTDKQGQILETQVVTKTGDIREVEIKANFVVLHGRTLLQGLFCDITERKLAEEALRRSEENFRRSLDDSPLGVRIVTIGGETIYANRAILDIYGYDSVEELRTTPVKKRYTPGSYAEFQIRREKRKQGENGPSEYEISIVRKDGEVRHLQVFRKEILWSGERQFQTIYQDITERKRVEDALRKSEARLVDLTEQQKMVLDALPQLVSFIDADLTYRFVNRSYEKFFECKDEDIVGRSLLEVIGPAVWELAERHVRRALAGEVAVYDEEFNYPDKEPRQMMGHLIPHRGTTGSVDGYFAVLLDITERKRAEAEVQASREQMRALAGRLQAVREEERTLIAREIHDELGGALTGLKIDVSLLTRAALKIENETIRTSLIAGMDSMIKFTDATIQTVRRIAMELRPGVLDDLGLVAALEWQLKDFEKRTGIRCEFFPPGKDMSLDADLSTALFRIFQETLTNVARHSCATEVRVRFRTDADGSTLEVEDNGKGIEKEKTLSSKSLGLLGMRERAQMFGGRITVTGTPGRGTIVTVEIPPVEKRQMDRDHEGAAG